MRMHAGEDDTDVDEVNAEFVEVEVLVKESSQVGRTELVKEVKKFLRSGASRRYLTGHFKISGTQQRLALNKTLSYIPYKARLLLALFVSYQSQAGSTNTTLERFSFIFLDFRGWDLLRTNVDSLLVSQEEEAIRGTDLNTAPLKVRCSEAEGYPTLQRVSSPWSLFRVVRLELGGAEVEEIAGGSEEEEVILLLIGTNTCFKL